MAPCLSLFIFCYLVRVDPMKKKIATKKWDITIQVLIILGDTRNLPGHLRLSKSYATNAENVLKTKCIFFLVNATQRQFFVIRPASSVCAGLCPTTCAIAFLLCLANCHRQDCPLYYDVCTHVDLSKQVNKQNPASKLGRFVICLLFFTLARH